jgi:hypothetical protein
MPLLVAGSLPLPEQMRNETASQLAAMPLNFPACQTGTRCSV